jgi:hypothetical protein
MALSSLAASGVAIDNWPAASRLPDITFGPPQLRTPVVQTFEEVTALAYVSMEITPVSEKPRVIAPRPMPRARWSASFRRSLATVPAGESLIPTLPEPVDSLSMILPMPSLALSEVPEIVETWQPLQAPVSSATAQAEEEGFFSAARRKTSASLDKARTSLVDAVRAVGGAVRILKR